MSCYTVLGLVIIRSENLGAPDICVLFIFNIFCVIYRIEISGVYISKFDFSIIYYSIARMFAPTKLSAFQS